MSDLVGNPEDRFSCVATHIMVDRNRNFVLKNEASTFVYIYTNVVTTLHLITIISADLVSVQ